VLLLQFSQKQPKVNSRPTGENSPNLVTQEAALTTVMYCVQGDQIGRIFATSAILIFGKF
jgi:hypothetical protein